MADANRLRASALKLSQICFSGLPDGYGVVSPPGSVYYRNLAIIYYLLFFSLLRRVVSQQVATPRAPCEAHCVLIRTSKRRCLHHVGLGLRSDVVTNSCGFQRGDADAHRPRHPVCAYRAGTPQLLHRFGPFLTHFSTLPMPRHVVRVTCAQRCAHAHRLLLAI